MREEEIYKMLERLKKLGVLSVYSLDGDDIKILEKLVEMKLATKNSTRLTTHYFYGVDGHDERNN